MLNNSIVALVAPMESSGQLDYDAFRNLVRWHLEQNTSGLVVNGTTGESPTLNANEKYNLVKIAVDLCKGKIPVIAGVGTNSTLHTIDEIKYIQKLGVDACLVVTPYYNRPSQEGLFQHYKKISESCFDSNIIIYNVPSRTACDIESATVGKLSECKNIIGIKDATGDISRVRQLKDSCGEDFALLSGDDSSLMEFIGYGGHGVISVLANVVPKKIAALCDLAKDDIKKATALNEELLALNNVMHLEVNPVTIKFIMQELGLIKSGIRLPLVNLSDELKTIVRKAISKTSIGEININYYADA